MYNPHDPRFRRTLNTVSQRLESANETAQISLFSLSENCLKPCFFSVGNCLEATTEFCVPTGLREDLAGGARRRRTPRQARGRLERSFDFYDDWEQDEDEALLAWENEENDQLLGGEGDATGQPVRRGIMNYGTSGTDAIIRAIGGSGTPGNRRPQRRNTTDADPTVIPNSSFFGFLDRLPFKLGPRGTRYKPSAAGLVERSKNSKGEEEEENEEDHDPPQSRSQGRNRSGTVNSERTEDSLSSRGDIFPSDDEVEDAIAFDDEYAARLVPDDSSSGKTRKERRRMKRISSNSSQAQSSQSASRRESAYDFGQSYSETTMTAKSPSKSSTDDLVDLTGPELHSQSDKKSQESGDESALPSSARPASPEIDHDTTNK